MCVQYAAEPSRGAHNSSGMLRDRYIDIRQRIGRAAEAVGRDPASVTLIAVSKTVSVERIRELYDLGHRDFGESRWQEAMPKIQALPADIAWHFIGTLQSNKARRIAESFSFIHTVASLSQVQKLDFPDNRCLHLLEVNIAAEAQKAGILPGALDSFRKSVLECSQVKVRGLMTIGPAVDDLEVSRCCFRKLRELRDEFGIGDLLSMGMSQDFEVAIQEGSTHVRVGTALFGDRA